MVGRVTRDAGFTLIELMIVVTVLALLTTTISLSANRPRSATAADDARFQAVHALLSEQAVLSRQVLGLQIDSDGYQRLRWQGGDWVTQGDAVRWRDGVTVLAPFDLHAPVQFAPSGQATPLRIRFRAGGRTRMCESDGWSGVTCRAG